MDLCINPLGSERFDGYMNSHSSTRFLISKLADKETRSIMGIHVSIKSLQNTLACSITCAASYSAGASVSERFENSLEVQVLRAVCAISRCSLFENRKYPTASFLLCTNQRETEQCVEDIVRSCSSMLPTVVSGCPIVHFFKKQFIFLCRSVTDNFIDF